MESRKKRFENPKGDDPRGPWPVYDFCLWLREVRVGAPQESLDEPVLERTLQASH